MRWGIFGMIPTGENQNSWGKTSLTIRPPQTPHLLARDQVQPLAFSG